MHYRDNTLPQRKTRDLLGVIGISIALLACVITAWGHGSPGDEGYDADYDYEADHDRYRGFDIHHTHSTTSYANGNPKEDKNNWHWHLNADDWHLNADDTSHAIDSGVFDSGESHGDILHDHSYVNQEGKSHSGLHLHKNEDIPDSHHTFGGVNGEGHDGFVDKPHGQYVGPMDEPEPFQERSPRVEQSRGDEESQPAESPEPELSPEPEYIPPSPTCDENFSVGDIICYNWQITERYQLIGFPILPSFGIDTLNWFHYYLENKLQRRKILFHVFIDGSWLSYRGGGRNEANPELGDILISPHLAIMVNFTRAEKSVGFLGTPQLGEVIDLEPGIHLIGLPETPSNFGRASDFLSVDGIEWVKIGYAPSKIINSTDDKVLQAGQAIRISVTESVTLNLSGSDPEISAAPMARRRGTLTTSWGTMKKRR